MHQVKVGASKVEGTLNVYHIHNSIVHLQAKHQPGERSKKGQPKRWEQRKGHDGQEEQRIGHHEGQEAHGLCITVHYCALTVHHCTCVLS